MKTTYLFKEETTNGQKKLRIGTAEEFDSVKLRNRSLPAEERRYFIKEKALDLDQPDILIIEVDRDEYDKWNKENVIRCRNIKAAQRFTMMSMESVMQNVRTGKVEEFALSREDPMFEEVITDMMLEELRQMLADWQPWALDVLNARLEGRYDECVQEISQKYRVMEQTARRYVRQFEQKTKNFFGRCSF